ncbi:MAG: hypothetical protein IKO91_07230 [Oscillospiraceae bacterium]|nr:hypothetical protein [Oscillospiraceae bacterium]
MRNLMRAHWYRLLRSVLLLAALLVILACDLFLSTRVTVTTSNMRELPMLCTSGAFMSYADSTSMSVSMAKGFFRKRGQLEESSAEDLIGVFQDIHPFQFRWVLATRRGMLAIPLIFAMAFLAMDFERRSYLNALYTGRSRASVYCSKLIFLFLCAFGVSLLGICALTGIYAGTVYSRLPAAYVWTRLALHALSDAALMAPPLLLVCALRKTVVSGAIILAYDFLLRFTSIFPMSKMDMSIWEQGGNILPTLLWSVGILLVCSAAGWFFFRKAKLN